MSSPRGSRSDSQDSNSSMTRAYTREQGGRTSPSREYEAVPAVTRSNKKALALLGVISVALLAVMAKLGMEGKLFNQLENQTNRLKDAGVPVPEAPREFKQESPRGRLTGGRPGSNRG